MDPDELRDLIAIEVMKILLRSLNDRLSLEIADPSRLRSDPEDVNDRFDALCEGAYDVADRMMAARGKA